MRKKLFIILSLIALILTFMTTRGIYAGTGALFGTASILSRFTSALLPQNTLLEKELLLLSDLCKDISCRTFTQAVSTSPASPHASWQSNQAFLSQIPAEAPEDIELLLFLEKRWLAKANGIYPQEVQWAHPCYGLNLQVNPETTNCYSRNPALGLSTSYISRVRSWIKTLPQPKHYPLILTRPTDLQGYLPSAIIDLTPILGPITDPQKWQDAWNQLQLRLPPSVYIQKVAQKDFGGIRLLPFNSDTPEKIQQDHDLLLQWIGTFGLSATRVELDRVSLPFLPAAATPIPFHIEHFDTNITSSHPQKALMIDATLQLLRGLSSLLPKTLSLSSTRSALASLTFSEIKTKLHYLSSHDELSFLDTMTHIEEIHNHLSTLLEIFSPYRHEDFHSIYKKLLISIPQTLQSFTSCGIHASGMTNFAGIVKAAQEIFQEPPHILYGENTYFECIGAPLQNASPISQATDTHWKKANLLLVQYNPVLRRNHSTHSLYTCENISHTLHTALKHRQGKPFIAAIDCTLDTIDSPRIGKLLEEFQEPISRGILAIFCYRSGIKYDLFGMDNYFGAPFYTIHNPSTHWAPLANLFTDPSLQADRLSLNWFCLAYQHTASHLDTYRKQIFDNTRTLLSRLPSSLLNPSAPYRVIPFAADTDPTFIDLKISGPLHHLRGPAIAAGLLYTKSLTAGQPLLTRPSFGFYHPNFSMIFDPDVTTIRITLGLDPAPIATILETLTTLSELLPQIDP